ncbi:MAG: hypothetical protein COX57_01605 [Alphaproteobacteria bacterium CG_4_10_14_0_2_um_filter_63_37]|nr:MAG: hypothetical protein AUJ55_12070 [Proteobacteria bacterium CG1_02_64_396]PJA25706.1 MAG: hypothetical protein COX57_01605 [Alphaproteobacteria bacterium CG_4_10_14_0_2_um_filter_63_37]
MKPSLLLRLGMARSLVLISTLMVTLSVTITILTLEIMEVEDWAMGVTLAIAIPLLLAPIHTYQTYRHLLALEKLNRELRTLATTDELTGARTRRHFFELAEEAMHQASRYSFPITLLMLDIDYFKRINDLHGHEAGDRALRVFGEVLREQVRAVDVVGRMGGEEFAILMPHTRLEGGQTLAMRIAQGLKQAPIAIEQGQVHLTVSIGVTECERGGRDLNDLLRQADLAMYAAKDRGRDRIAVWRDGRPFLV